MYLKILTPLLLLSFSCLAQTDEVSLDLLRAPSSPASILTGISPSEIEKPSDVSSFMVSLQQATNNFSQLPKSYAIDFAPGLLMGSRNLTIDRFRSNKVLRNLEQSFTISAAFRNLEAGEEDSLMSPKTKFGIGFKFSVLRGTLSKEAGQLLDDIIMQQKRVLNLLTNELDSLLKKDLQLQMADSMMALLEDSGRMNTPDYVVWQQMRNDRESSLKEVVTANNKEELDRLQEKGRNFKLTKVGWKVDFAGGLVVDFLERTFNQSYITKGGIWVTGGNETESGWTFLAIGRFLFNPDKVFADDQGVIKAANTSTFDMGGRIVFSYPSSRFSLSSEALYRSVLNNDEVDPSWRFTLNADYDIGNNRKLTFAFGRDFDGTVSKSGNLVAALNFLLGFGNKKKTQPTGKP